VARGEEVEMAAADPRRWVIVDGSSTPGEVADAVGRAVEAVLA